MLTRANPDLTLLPPADTGALLVAYFPVNDPLIPFGMLSAFAHAEVDVVEIGLKAREAYMDGDIVAASMARAEGNGRINEAVEIARAVRAFPRPALGALFCYAEAGVEAATVADWREFDAVLCLSRNDARRQAVLETARAGGSRSVAFLPHRFDAADIVRGRTAEAYVMVQYSAGVTGLRDGLDESFQSRIKTLKQSGIGVPIVTGIGISSPDQIRHALDHGADGVVIGSMAIRKALEGRAALEDYLGRMRELTRHG